MSLYDHTMIKQCCELPFCNYALTAFNAMVIIIRPIVILVIVKLTSGTHN